MVDKIIGFLTELWSQTSWVEALMATLPFIPLLFYMWVIRQFRKAGQITDRYNSADKVAFTLYIISVPIAIFIHIYFKLGPFVSFLLVWAIWAVAIKLVWAFFKFMAARERRQNQLAKIERQKALQRENRKKRGLNS